MTEETLTDHKTNVTIKRRIMLIDKIVDQIVRVMVGREQEVKEFGAIVLA